ncbi:ATPase [Sporolactobacillus inulinus CASD]|nr:ATPase [Sporolactobacillus inulinus CASD]
MVFLCLISVLSLAMLAGCQVFDFFTTQVEGNLKGLNVTMQTYDADGQPIDTIKGVSGAIKRDSTFDRTNEKGEKTKESSVLNITIGGKQVLHVGSTLIMYEKGLQDVMNKLPQKVLVTNQDRSLPFVNRMVNQFHNYFDGRSKIVLIRSQLGKPIATFAGNRVSYFATDVPNSTGLIIDGKYLFIYRCDFTMYDTSLIER